MRLLALTHLSPATAAARSATRRARSFPNTVVPRDFDIVEIPFPEKGEPTVHRARRRARPGLSLMAAKLFPMLSAPTSDRSLRSTASCSAALETFRFPADGEPASSCSGSATRSSASAASPPQPLHGRPQRPVTGQRVELCVDVDDVDASLRARRRRGFEQVTPPADMPWGERIAWIADPDGNLVMLTR